jgi:hypothetical protein
MAQKDPQPRRPVVLDSIGARKKKLLTQCNRRGLKTGKIVSGISLIMNARMENGHM